VAAAQRERKDVKTVDISVVWLWHSSTLSYHVNEWCRGYLRRLVTYDVAAAGPWLVMKLFIVHICARVWC